MKNTEAFAAGERVTLGMEFLDGVMPGWDKKIDTKTLDIGYSETCAFGQLFGDYEVGCEMLGVGYASPAAYELGVYADSRRQFRRLTGIWRARINERRNPAAPRVAA